MDFNETLLLKGFCAAVWGELSGHTKKRIREEQRFKNKHTPRFPEPLSSLPYYETYSTDFEFLHFVCSDNQKFADMLAASIRWIKDYFELQDRDLKIFLKNIDFSGSTPAINFTHFQLENVSFDGANLMLAEFNGTALRRDLPKHQIRQYTPSGPTTFFGANIAGREIKTFGRGLGYDQYRVSGAFGNAAQNTLVGITYPRDRTTAYPFRLFIECEEILPQTVIDAASVVHSPNREMLYNDIRKVNSLDFLLERIAEEAHRLQIISGAFAKASQVHPQSAQNFQDQCQNILVGSGADPHAIITIWRGLCLTR